MSDEINVLLKLCEEEWAQRRQSESQRATITHLLMTAAMAIVVFVFQKGMGADSIPLAILLMFIGLYGALTTAKFYERGELHMTRARHWRSRISELCPQAQLLERMKNGNAEHNNRYPILKRVRLYFLWIFLHASITIIWCIILIIAILR